VDSNVSRFTAPTGNRPSDAVQFEQQAAAGPAAARAIRLPTDRSRAALPDLFRADPGFFFPSRRRHTRSYGDWSSDVCSSDLTGISVVTDFQLETAFLGALPIKLAGGSRTPDIFMFLTYGQGISAGWLEPLNTHYSDRSLTDLGWYDESDLLKTAGAFPVWSNGERYAFPITSEAVTLFVNSDALAAKNLPVPRTFDELLATAKTVKTNEMSGIAMRAQASGNSSPAAMSYVFSYGGHMVKGNKAAFASPEAIAAVAIYGETLRQAGPIGVGSYEWYHVLNDFVQGRTAMAIDSSVLAKDISDPANSRVAKQAAFAAFPHADGRSPVPFMSHWQACINSRSQNKRAAFLFLLWATSKPTSLQTAASGLATT